MKIISKTRMIKFFAMLSLLIIGVTAKAENTLSIGNFSIASDEPVQVPVMLTNSDPVAALQFTVVMPQNLTLVEIERNAERFSQGQTFSSSTVTGNVMIASLQGNTLTGNSGAIAYLTVKANSVGNPTTETIELTKITMSTVAGDRIESNTSDSGTVSVGYGTATVTATPQLYINPDGSATVTVSLQNDFAVNGIQTVLTLSPGLSIREGSVELTERATGSAVATLNSRGNGKYGLTVAGFGDNGQSFTGNSGEIFSFIVDASSDFTSPTGTVNISDFGCSRNGTGITNVTVWANNGNIITVNLINGLIKYQEAQASIQGLRESLENTLSQIQSQCPDVYEQFPGTDISARIDALEEAVNAAYADLTLTPDYDSIMAPASEINASIGSLLEQAIAAQAMFELNQRNAEAKVRADETIQSLQESLNEMLDQIRQQYPDVAGQEQLSGANVQSMIDNLISDVQTAYDNQKLADNYETVMAPVPAIEEAIQDLLVKAAAAQDQYEKDQAQKALDEALARANAVVSALEKALNDNTRYIDTYFPNVAQLFKVEEYEISEAIDDLKDAIQAAYNDGTLSTDYESVVTEVADALQARIDALLTDAQEANDKYTANETQKNAADQVVAGLQSNLAQTLQTIQRQCPDVADQFTGDDINNSINDLISAINEAYANGTLAEDYDNIVTDPAETISGDITALLEAALAAQQAHNQAIQEALDAKKAEADAAIQALEESLASTLSQIESLYPDVAGQAELSGENERSMINNLKSAVQNAYDNRTLVDNYDNIMSPVPSIEEAIAQLLVKAASAQQQYEQEQAQKALDEALKNANALVASLEKALDKNSKYIDAHYPNVAQLFKAEEYEISEAIDELRDAIQEAYSNGTLATDYDNVVTSDANTIQGRINALLTDAEEANNKYIANETQKREADAVVAGLRDQLASTLKTIQRQCADVADQFTGDDINTSITNLVNAINESYNNGTLVNDYATVVTAPAETISSDIAALLEAAIAAQQAHDQAIQDALDAKKAEAQTVVSQLQAQLAAALETIQSECPDVYESFPGTAVQAAINNLQAGIDEAYENGTLINDYRNVVTNPAANIAAQIEKLIEDAKAAQLAHSTLEGAHNNALSVIAELQSSLDEAISYIQENCPDVADQFTGASIQRLITNLSTNVENAYSNGTLVNDYNTIMSPVSSIQTAIENLLNDAKAAQKAINEQNALDAARNAALAVVANLQSELDAAVAQISEEYPDVASQFTGEAISNMIKTIRSDALNAYNAGTLVKNYDILVTEPAEDVEAAIAELIANAQAAQEAADTQKALDRALQNANQVVSGLENELNEALETIREQYPDVANQFNGQDITDDINNLKQQINNAYSDGSLTENYDEDVTAPAAEISQAIEDMLAEAKEAQEAADTQKALDSALANANEVVSGLENELNEALETIKEQYPDVADQFNGQDILDEIAALQETIDNAYADGSLTEDYEEDVTTPAAEISKAIADMLAKAKEDQEAADTQKALDSALENANEVVSGLEDELNEALETIKEQYPDVADQFNGQDILDEIAALQETIDNAYADGSLTEDYEEDVTTPAAEISKAIEEMLAKAKEAQEAADTQKALDSALENANEVVKGLEDELNEALEAIKKQYPDVADQFNGQDILDEIAGLQDEINNAYTDGSLTEDYNDVVTTPSEGISKAIEDMLEAAAAAQEAFENEQARQEANKAAYEEDLAEIEELQEQLDAAIEEIKSNYPDFDYNDLANEIQEAIDEQKEQADEAYEDVIEDGLYNNVVDTDSIIEMIENLLQAATNSGIGTIYDVFNEKEVRIFTIDGVQVPALQKGKINILVYPNGQTKNILVR